MKFFDSRERVRNAILISTLLLIIASVLVAIFCSKRKDKRLEATPDPKAKKQTDKTPAEAGQVEEVAVEPKEVAAKLEDIATKPEAIPDDKPEEVAVKPEEVPTTDVVEHPSPSPKEDLYNFAVEEGADQPSDVIKTEPAEEQEDLLEPDSERVFPSYWITPDEIFDLDNGVAINERRRKIHIPLGRPNGKDSSHFSESKYEKVAPFEMPADATVTSKIPVYLGYIQTKEFAKEFEKCKYILDQMNSCIDKVRPKIESMKARLRHDIDRHTEILDFLKIQKDGKAASDSRKERSVLYNFLVKNIAAYVELHDVLNYARYFIDLMDRRMSILSRLSNTSGLTEKEIEGLTKRIERFELHNRIEMIRARFFLVKNRVNFDHDVYIQNDKRSKKLLEAQEKIANNKTRVSSSLLKKCKMHLKEYTGELREYLMGIVSGVRHCEMVLNSLNEGSIDDEMKKAWEEVCYVFIVVNKDGRTEAMLDFLKKWNNIIKSEYGTLE